jgi:tape measure domain-containing protein
LAFAQTTAKGRLMGQELNQMTERGFNPLQIISKKTGISMGDLMKRMEEGKIDIKAVAEAFRIATSKGGDFYQAIEKGSTTTSGKIAKVADNLTQLKVAFGTGFNDGLKIALDAANTKLPQLMSKFAEFGTLIGKTIQDAVNGDLTRFFMVGELIGEALVAGMEVALKSMGDKIKDFSGDKAKYVNIPTFLADKASEKIRKENPNLDEALKKAQLEIEKQERQESSEALKLRMSELSNSLSQKYGEALNLPTALPQKSGPHPNMPGVSYAPEGYPGITVDEKGHRIMFDIKTGIDALNQKLAPQP